MKVGLDGREFSVHRPGRYPCLQQTHQPSPDHEVGYVCGRLCSHFLGKKGYKLVKIALVGRNGMQRTASLILHVLYESLLKHKKNTLANGKGIKAMLPEGRAKPNYSAC